MNGERYLGNANKMEVHDLDNEGPGPSERQIVEIIRVGNDRPYNTLADAHAAGHDNWAWCLGRSPDSLGL